MTGRPRPIWVELVTQAIAIGGLCFTMKLCMQYLDPYRAQREQAKKQAAHLRKKLGRALVLNEFEQLLAVNVMNPAHIEVDVAEISGLDHIIEELQLRVLYPLQRTDLYCTTLWKQSMGVLFYGPPGTGKTMLAKALAKQSGCYFLNISSSSILSKWLGDASRLVRAVFTLAQKLQPCIIFIDEVDALLGKRGMNHEHEATLQVKTEFMQLWDGMESSRGQRVVVMGATNRPWMVDPAVLRRFSTQYEIGLPNAEQRLAILTGYLKRHNTETGLVASPLVRNLPDKDDPECSGLGPVTWIAAQTNGYSGSDLMELTSQAAQRGLADYWRSTHHARGSSGSFSGSQGARDHEQEVDLSAIRKMNRDDFVEALKVVFPSSHQAEDYSHRSSGSLRSGANGRPQSLTGVEELMAMLLKAVATGAQAGSDASKREKAPAAS